MFRLQDSGQLKTINITSCNAIGILWIKDLNHGLLFCFEYYFDGANKNSDALYRTEAKDLPSDYLWKNLTLLKRKQRLTWTCT